MPDDVHQKKKRDPHRSVWEYLAKTTRADDAMMSNDNRINKRHGPQATSRHRTEV
jgi:hypothetical protein